MENPHCGGTNQHALTQTPRNQPHLPVHLALEFEGENQSVTVKGEVRHTRGCKFVHKYEKSVNTIVWLP